MNKNRVKEILEEDATNDWKIRMIEEECGIWRDWLGVRINA